MRTFLNADLTAGGGMCGKARMAGMLCVDGCVWVVELENVGRIERTGV